MSRVWRWLVSLIAFFSHVGLLNADEAVPLKTSKAPMVAGFERFGRHSDIEDELAGKLLIRELSCSACHATKHAVLQHKPGPDLQNIGNRVQTDWLAEYLTTPHQLKIGTTMPDVLAGLSAAKKPAVIEALSTFLARQKTTFEDVKASGTNPVLHEFWKAGNSERGRALFHAVGCVACHEPDAQQTVSQQSATLDRLLETLDADEIQQMGLASAARRVESIPLGDVARKYTLQGLAYFLIDPLKVRSAGRMPSLKLNASEAADLAAYLLEGAFQHREQILVRQAKQPPNQEEQVSAGQKLFSQLGCANCHAVAGVDLNKASVLVAKSLEELDVDSQQGCLADSHQQQKESSTGLRVRYQLDESQRQCIAKALRALKHIVEEVSAKEHLQLDLLSYNCFACHQRDELGGVGRFRTGYFETVGSVDIGDEGRLPPPLTGVGRKLTTARLKNVLAGKDSDIRPFMTIRMPKFSSIVVNQLPSLLEQVDLSENPTQTESAVFGSPAELKKMVEVGRELMDVGCVQCHQFRGHALPGVVGVDLQGIESRVRPEWFLQFLMNPGAVKLRTRMPTFFPDGRSQRADLLDGHPRKQITAMWAYLKSLNSSELPAKIQEARLQNYELVPTEKPILLRTFMQQAGTHAVAVGFPQKVHFAFDAELSRPSLAWRGRFIDAQSTWFVRLSPPSDPLGSQVIAFPEGQPLAMLENKNQAWPVTNRISFGGFRIDAQRVPTFLYSLPSFSIEDRIVPNAKGDMLRQIKVNERKIDAPSTQEKLHFLAHRSASLNRLNASSCTSQSGLRVEILEPNSSRQAAFLRTVDGVDEWIVPIELTDSTGRIDVRYSW